MKGIKSFSIAMLIAPSIVILNWIYIYRNKITLLDFILIFLFQIIIYMYFTYLLTKKIDGDNK